MLTIIVAQGIFPDTVVIVWSKALLIHFVHGCLSATKIILNNSSRNCIAVKLKRLIIWPFTAKVCQALIYTISSGFV